MSTVDPKSFSPCLFIGVGATGAYFTLRETYLHAVTRYDQTFYEVWSHHHFNLSQDPDEAFEKAKKHAEETFMLPLRTTREGLNEEMREIKRANAEEIERRQKAYEEQQRIFEEERLQREQEKLDDVKQGLFPFGRYYKKPFCEAPIGYINWLVKEEYEEGSIYDVLKKEIINRVPEMILPTPDKTIHIGTIGERRAFRVRILKHFVWEGYYGYTHFVEMIDLETNACIVSKGAFAEAQGEILTIKGTIKAHDDYKGQAQTVIQRVQKVK